MALLARSRRPLALIALAILAIPALAMLALPPQTVSPTENRRLAPTPAVPQTPAEWRRLPRALDAFAADHFGFRLPLARRAQHARKWLGGDLAPQAQVTEGPGGRLLLLEGLLRSTGVEVDPARAADYADFVCAATRRLKARGAAVVFGLAPSPTSVYPERAPDWAGPVRRPNEYDLVLAAARRCVPTADLRAALITERGAHDLYQRADTHWTPRGGLLALNSLTKALGRPELADDPAAIAWSPQTVTWGDLPRLAGRAPEAETVELPNVPPMAPSKPLPITVATGREPFAIDTGRPGPRVLILGDSFAQNMLPFLALHTSRIVWLPQDDCGFDWRLIEAEAPEIVLIMPAERKAYCLNGRRPIGFPALPPPAKSAP